MERWKAKGPLSPLVIDESGRIVCSVHFHGFLNTDSLAERNKRISFIAQLPDYHDSLLLLVSECAHLNGGSDFHIALNGARYLLSQTPSFGASEQKSAEGENK